MSCPIRRAVISGKAPSGWADIVATNRHQLLVEAVAVSRRMLMRAEVDDWAEVIQLEAERRNLLEQAFATRAPVDEDLARKVREILELDKDLIARSLQVRDLVAAELSQASRGRKVADAYRSAAR